VENYCRPQGYTVQSKAYASKSEDGCGVIVPLFRQNVV
jgi:hypothetical protein